MKIDQSRGPGLDVSNIQDPKNGIFDEHNSVGSMGSLDDQLDPNVITQKMENWL
jgi:hypothetical protein